MAQNPIRRGFNAYAKKMLEYAVVFFIEVANQAKNLFLSVSSVLISCPNNLSQMLIL